MELEAWNAPPGDRIPNNPRFAVLLWPAGGERAEPPAPAAYDSLAMQQNEVVEGSRQSVVLLAEPVAVAAARSWLESQAAAIVADDRLASLALVISEIVTNAVRHGKPGGEIQLAATPKQDYLCVQVTDEGSGFVPRPGAMASEENGGFGLFLVERLTRRWGMTREGMRTRVWFEFDYGAAAAS